MITKYQYLLDALSSNAIVSHRCTCFQRTTNVTTIGRVLSFYRSQLWCHCHKE